MVDPARCCGGGLHGGSREGAKVAGGGGSDGFVGCDSGSGGDASANALRSMATASLYALDGLKWAPWTHLVDKQLPPKIVD